MAVDELRLYPDPKAENLRKKIGEIYGLGTEEVFVGNGSDEVLSFCFYLFFDSDNGKLLFPEHTYSFYPVYCDFYGIEYEKVPMKTGMSIDLEAFLSAPPPCGTIFPNPNAPTGMYMEIEEIDTFLQKIPEEKIVIIDEAYSAFGGNTAAPLLKDHPNLLVVNTFSKSLSLAGIRLGYALGASNLIAALFTVKDSFNSYPVDYLTQKLGETALGDKEYYRKINSKIIATREHTASELSAIGWTVFPSKANFILAGKPGVSGETVYRGLKEEGILVRWFDKKGIRDYVRITIGRDEEMEIFLETVKRLF
jgi:histidinol-phosphate aminotransferase